MSHETRRIAQGVRRLPTVRLDGVDYFIDERLREFRAVWNPHYRIEFNSETGLDMLDHLGIVNCPECGQECGIPLPPATTEDNICPICQAVVGYAGMRPAGHGDAAGRP